MPGRPFESEIILALTSAVDSGALRIIDLTFVHKDAQGNVTSYELAELEDTNSLHTISWTRRVGSYQSETLAGLADEFHLIARPC